MKSLLFYILFFLSFCNSTLLASELPYNVNYINDDGNMISSGTEKELNSLLLNLENETGNQFFVLTIKSLNGQTINTYANEVFNEWNIGQKNIDNGVLLVISARDKELKIEVGYGLEGELTDSESGRIIREIILPYFQQGYFDTGIKNGVLTIIQEVKGFTGLPEEDTSFSPFYLIILGVLCLILIIYLIRRYLRNKPRRSKKTGEKMIKLSEKEENEFLNEGEQLEEKIGAIDYDVWVTADRDDVEIIAYKSKLSKYRICRNCGHKTQKKTGDQIIQQATYRSSGTGTRTFTCLNCNHTDTQNYRISRKQRSSGRYYGGGGYSGRGFSGGGGGFSGGGFSGGSGGFSGGGGASGSW